MGGAWAPPLRIYITHPTQDVRRSSSAVASLAAVATLASGLGDGWRRWVGCCFSDPSRLLPSSPFLCCAGVTSVASSPRPLYRRLRGWLWHSGLLHTSTLVQDSFLLYHRYQPFVHPSLFFTALSRSHVVVFSSFNFFLFTSCQPFGCHLPPSFPNLGLLIYPPHTLSAHSLST